MSIIICIYQHKSYAMNHMNKKDGFSKAISVLMY